MDFEKSLEDLIKQVHFKCERKLKLVMSINPPVQEEMPTIDKSVSVVAEGEVAELVLHKPVQDLMTAILSDPEINMFFHLMFWQQRKKPNEGKQIQCWQEMIIVLDYIMTMAPKFDKTGYTTLPIYIILKWPMATVAGFAAFLNNKVNRLLKNLLNYWGEFLSGPDSRYVLNDHPRSGWFGADAMEAMPNFVEEYECDPKVQYYGFKSWDDFFTRVYRPGIRPVEAPDDDSVVANCCESAPIQISKNVRMHDYLWIKNQHYSLRMLLNNNNRAKEFVGGTIYQAYLSARSYHRWHSPVSGTILEVELVDGSYFSQLPNIENDPTPFYILQTYLAQVAARGIIYILADNPDIGLVCFVSIGMAEVSSNEVTVKKGDYIKKGDQLGMFHFGGSSHCLIFRKEVQIEFDLRGQTPGSGTNDVPVRSKIAIVRKKHF